MLNKALTLLLIIFSFTFSLSAELRVSNSPVLIPNLNEGEVPDIYECDKQNYCLSLAGEISTGDYFKLKPIIEEAAKEYYLERRTHYGEVFKSLLDDEEFNYNPSPVLQLILDSPGGNVNEAIKIAKLIKNLGYATQVPLGKKCLSSCFYLFAAGTTRVSISEESLGIHTPYFEKEFFNELTQQEAELLYLGRVENSLSELSKLFIPEDLIEKARNTPSDKIYFLDQNERASISINRVHNERLLSLCSTLLNTEVLECSWDLKGAANRILQFKTIDEYFEDEFKDSNYLSIALVDSWWLQALMFSLIKKNGLPSDFQNKSRDNNYMNFLENLSPSQLELVQKMYITWYKKIFDFEKANAVINDDESLERLAEMLSDSNAERLTKADVINRLKLIFYSDSPLENVWNN